MMGVSFGNKGIREIVQALPRFRLILFLLSILTSILVTAVYGYANEPLFQDENAIIRSLAPYKYLPEHSGKQPSIDLNIPFDLEQATLKPSARRQLDVLASALRTERLKDAIAMIIGHTDAAGTAAFNQQLSEQRAAAVKNYLVGEHKMNAKRFVVRGVGEEQLINPLAPESAINRRVEVRVVGSLANGTSEKKNTIKW